MRRGFKVRELMQREGLSGEVFALSRTQRTGIIHGDDGYDVTFNEDSLILGLAYCEVGIGLRVSYGVFFARGVPTAINVRPVSGSRTETPQEAENTVSGRAGGLGVV